MTFDWQVLAAACGAISLRLVAIGSSPEVVKALDEHLHQKPDGILCLPQDQAGSQANDCYSHDRSDLKSPDPAAKDIQDAPSSLLGVH